MRGDHRKDFTLAATIVGVLLTVSLPAQAVNPVSWSFTIETSGEDVSWTSNTFVDPGWPQYDYSYEITELSGNFDFWGWVNLIDLIPLEDRSGSGQEPGPLPIEVANEFLGYPDSGPPYDAAANVHIYVDGSGYGHADITDVVLGSLPVFGQLNAIRFGGDIDMAGVIPEPTTLLLLSGSTGLLVIRRRYRVY